MERELNKMEFAFRYEVYQNITTENLARPDRNSDQFKTEAYTAGLNYYIKNQYAKIQANYIFVDDPQSKSHGLREVKNNVFALCFQVGF
jgi:phosphate-selective porin